MKRNISIAFISFLALAGTALAQLLVPNDSAIRLPTVATIKTETVLYQFASTPQLMGDGYRVYVARVDPEDLAEFIKSSVSIDPEWSHGSMQKYQLYLEILEWIEGGEAAQGTRGDLSKAVDIYELKQADGLLFRANFKRNGDGHLTDATLWIIRPERSQVIMFNQNT